MQSGSFVGTQTFRSSNRPSQPVRQAARTAIETLERRVLLSAGDLDTSFGAAGVVVPSFPGDVVKAVAVQADGKILVASQHSGPSKPTIDFEVTRYNVNGSLDSSFGSGGHVVSDFSGGGDSPAAMLVQSNGKILVTGTSISGSGTFFATARYNSNGTPDTGFSGDGLVRTDVSHNDSEASALAVQSDGRVLVAGSALTSNGTRDMAIVRYTLSGNLDSSFDSDGKVTLDFGSTEDAARGIAVRGDGKIVVGGQAFGVSGAAGLFALARFDSAGHLDSSFGSGGKTKTDFAGTNDDARVMAMRSDGSILLGGQAIPFGSSTHGIELARYTSAGRLDTSFGSGGRKVFIHATDNQAESVAGIAIQSDGKVLLADLFTNSSIPGSIAAVRFTSGGQIDTTFGSGGIKVVELSRSLSAFAGGVAIQPGGKIILAGTASSGGGVDIALTRLTQPSGAVDSTFGSGGRVLVEIAGRVGTFNDVTVTGGKILAAGYTVSLAHGQDVYLARFNSNGSRDTTFGSGGAVVADFGKTDAIDELAVQSDGKIIVAGSVLARYTSTGHLDTSFGGGDGFVSFNDPTNRSAPHSSVAIQPDGKILVTHGGKVLRFNSNGTPDTSFGSAGLFSSFTFGTGLNSFDPVDVALQAGGKIVVAGTASTVQNVNPDFGVIRLNSNGTIDRTFGVNGASTQDSDIDQVLSLAIGRDGSIALAGLEEDDDSDTVFFRADGTPAAFDRINSWFEGSEVDVTTAPDGKFVVVGHHTDISSQEGRVVAIRYNADFTRDSTFGGNDGVETLAPGTNRDFAEAVAVQPDGNVVVAGSGDFRPMVLRYLGGPSTGIVQARDGTLNIIGTSGNDNISVTASSGTVTAKLNGTTRTFAASSVARVIVRGGAGNDTIIVGKGVRGTANDFLTPPVQLYGEAGNDTLRAGDAKTRLIGGDGDDHLVGGSGDDDLSGGEGNDVLDGGGGADTLSGGRGNDTVDYSARTAAVNVTIGSSDNDGQTNEGDNVGFDVENVLGGSGNDTIDASTFDGKVNHIFRGNGGDDTLIGGAGNDTLVGGTGKDQLFGAAGNDTLFSRDGAVDSLDGGAGNDTAQFDSFDSRSSIEQTLA